MISPVAGGSNLNSIVPPNVACKEPQTFAGITKLSLGKSEIKTLASKNNTNPTVVIQNTTLQMILRIFATIFN
jgi:hypothetical protein